jgi:hypothetical protein
MLARTLVLSLMGMAAIAAVPAQGQSSFGNPAVIVVEADETGDLHGAVARPGHGDRRGGR